MIQLRGMTWNHDRGLAPMVATSARFQEMYPEVKVRWEVRSLRDFGDAPVEQLAEQFDLAVLDHPFMGDLARAGCFLALDEFIPAEERARLAADSVGPSHASYLLQDHQWALEIDAACQVASYRADLLEQEGVGVPQTWQEVLTLARRRPGFVSLALTPLDTLMSFFSLCANAGAPCFTRPDVMVDRETGKYALEMLRKLHVSAAPTANRENPIALYERMASSDETAYCPLAFGYSNYSRPGYRAHSLRYAETPDAGKGRVGATLGGAGLAVSARCAYREQALAYARWVTSTECQGSVYVASGGQPASRRAWKSEFANSLTEGYFASTLPALDTAWLRPRFAGFVPFQNDAGQVIAQCIGGSEGPTETLDAFDAMWRRVQEQSGSSPT